MGSGRGGEPNGCSEFHGGGFRGLRSLSGLHTQLQTQGAGPKGRFLSGASFSGVQQSCVPEEEPVPVRRRVLETLIS